MPHIISKKHQRAWRSFLTSQSLTTNMLDTRLRNARQISLDVYEVLQTLEDAEGQRLRMSELAETILFSRSGLTRMIDRLEEIGYVVREPSPDDRRGWYAKITEAGIIARHAACQIVENGLNEVWVAALSEDEAVRVSELLDGVVGRAKLAL
jgi:DNA-binding MarR family transcriptional regulator